MCDEVSRLRSEARRCRWLAGTVAAEKNQAVLRHLAREFDEAAEELERQAPGPPAWAAATRLPDQPALSK
jgi:hypothetical protein